MMVGNIFIVGKFYTMFTLGKQNAETWKECKIEKILRVCTYWPNKVKLKQTKTLIAPKMKIKLSINEQRVSFVVRN